ncbi:hypothetical protein AVEN_151899-1, partial [Araneus ventricosus]
TYLRPQENSFFNGHYRYLPIDGVVLRPQENSFFNGHYRYLPIDGVVNNNDLIPLRRTDKFANVATDLVRYQRNERERVRIAGTRTQRTAELNLQYHRLAFQYNPAVDYSSSRHVVIGQMSHVCTYRQALKFNNESSSFLIHAAIMCNSEAWEGTVSCI